MEENVKENTARLVSAAYDPSARPTAEVGERVRRLLFEHARAQAAMDDFPEVVVGFLGAMLAVAVVWLIARLAWGEASLYADPALLTIGVWAVANMFVVPVAGIVILKRRKYG